MAKIPSRVMARLVAGIKKFQPILEVAKSRDVNESNTVTIVTDMLSDIFGYDKYSEVTSEFAIRGTFCDVGIKVDGKLQLLIEVKSIGLELKDNHVKQAVDYAANQGIDWVVLTNGIYWRFYKVTFGKPIDQELIVEVNICSLNPRNEEELEVLFILCKEGWEKSIIGDFHVQKQALSRFFIASLIQAEPILDAMRKELRKLCPDIKVTHEQISEVLTKEVLKHEVMEGEKADESRRKIARYLNKQKPKPAKEDAPSIQTDVVIAQTPPVIIQPTITAASEQVPPTA